jgi:hypothetical protein
MKKITVALASDTEDFSRITATVKAIASKYMLKVLSAEESKDNPGEFVYTMYKKDKRAPFEFEFYVSKSVHSGGYKIDPVLVDPESTRQLVLTNVVDFFYYLKRKLM